MKQGWRGWSLFGAGALFGLVGGGVLYAPPEVQNAPAPWDHTARAQAAAAAATRVSGAGPAQPAAIAPPVQAASAAPQPVAAASGPSLNVQAPVVAEPPLAAASAPLLAAVPAPPAAATTTPPHKLVAAAKPAVVKKRKVEAVEPPVDTTVSGASRAFEPIRIQPEAPEAHSDGGPTEAAP